MRASYSFFHWDGEFEESAQGPRVCAGFLEEPRELRLLARALRRWLFGDSRPKRSFLGCVFAWGSICMCTHVHVNTAHIERCSNASLEHSLTEPAPEPRVFDGHAQALHRDLHVIRLIVYSSGASHRIIQAIRSATTPPEPGRAALVAASYLSRRSTEPPCMRSQDRLGTLTRRRGRKETR